jgi:hypothetical protein
MVIDAERRAALLGVKLGALVASAVGSSAHLRPAPFAAGAGLVEDRSGGGVGWVLADVDPARALGPAVVWAGRNGVGALHLLVDDAGAAGLLARRAPLFALSPSISRVAGRALEAAAPVAHVVEPPLDPRLVEVASMFVAAGCDRVVEHGRVVAEVAGLEVARVSIGADGEPLLEVGVGRFDREAHAMISGGDIDAARLAEVVRLVAGHRRPGAPPHPLKSLVPERALRARVVATPSLVGAERLVAVPPVVEAPDLRTALPAPAVGEAGDGAPVVVVCSTGIDLDVVPTAADTWLRDGRGGRLVVAVPTRDVHRVTEELAGALVVPAEVVGVPEPDPAAR